MAKVYKDFDEFFQEKDSTMVIKLFDKEYEIPASINAKVALTLARLAKENPNQEMDVEKVVEFLNLIYGEEVIEDWMDKGISIKQLTTVLTWTIQQYGQAKVEVPAEKKRKASVKKK